MRRPLRRRRPRPRRAGAVLGLGRSRPGPLPRRWRGRASPCSSRSPRPGPATPPRWRSSTSGGHPVYIQGAEVGLDTRETAEDVARTLACYHRVVVRPGVRPPRRSSAWRPPSSRGGVRRAGGQPALRRGPPVPGGRRPAHPARSASGRAARAPAGLRRRRQQHGALAGQGGPLAGMDVRSPTPVGYAVRVRRAGRGRGPASPTGRRAGPCGDRRPAPRRPRAPRPSTPTCGPRWARRTSGRPAWRPSRVHRRRRAARRGRAATPSCCTACPPTGARRSRAGCSTVRAAWCGGRRPTGCTAMRGLLAWVTEAGGTGGTVARADQAPAPAPDHQAAGVPAR